MVTQHVDNSNMNKIVEVSPKAGSACIYVHRTCVLDLFECVY